MAQGEAADGKTRVLVTLDDDVLERLDDEAARRDRQRPWMVQEGLRQWFRRLDRQRAIAARKRKRVR